MTGDFTRNPTSKFPRARWSSHRDAVGAGGGATSSTRRARHGADGRFHRHQPVHARLRLPEGPDAALGEAIEQGDRAQRRGGRDEQARVRLGPPRRARPRRRWSAARPACRFERRRRRETLDDIVAARVETSPPTRTRAYAERYADRRACAGEQEKAQGPTGSPRRSRATLQADGLQGRVRGRAALHRRRFLEEGRRSSRATTRCASTSRRRCSPSATRPPASCKKRAFGPWMMTAFRCWRS
jgi:hypothetical protein